MTNLAILEGFVAEIAEKIARKQSLYDDKKEKYFAAFQVRQAYTPALRPEVYRQLWHYTLDGLFAEKKAFIARLGLRTIEEGEKLLDQSLADQLRRDIQQINPASDPLSDVDLVREFILPDALRQAYWQESNRLAPLLQLADFFFDQSLGAIAEPDLVRLMELAGGPFYTLPNCNDPNVVDVHSRFMDISQLTRLLKAVFIEQPQLLTQQLKQKLMELANLPNLKANRVDRDNLQAVLNGKLGAAPVAATDKLPSASQMASDKKWKWLQDHPLGFTTNRAAFFALVEQLARLDYFDPYLMTDELREAIAQLRPEAYEAFILDVHAHTCEGADKRSQWFVGEKVVAYQVLVWLMFARKTDNRYAILAKIIEKGFHKIPKMGPTSRKMGDLGLRLLIESQSLEGLGILLKLQGRNKYPVFLEALDEAILSATRYTGLKPSDVEDFFVDHYGLADGQLARTFGEYECQVQVLNYDNVQVNWSKAGQPLKSEPTALKKSHPDDLKIWKSTINDLKKELSGQRIRIENFYKREKGWKFSDWNQGFFQHPLVQWLSRKLIWQFEEDGQVRNGFFWQNQFIDSAQTPFVPSERARVRLWHPATANPAEVVDWRQFLLAQEIKQPFKQAFREIYLVTDAEVTTATFSNRFRGHVLRMGKFVALAQQRLWQYTVSSYYNGDSPEAQYPDFGLSASFDLTPDVDFVIVGAVHFRDQKRNQALRMEQVPVLVFSETMRDLDLFVATCSIGTEDQFADTRYYGYWQGFSESDLSETAKTRRQVVQNVVARLRIRHQCEVTDRYLRVVGKKRVYKIHFGSGNILMEPNDQYLCIIPDRNKSGAGNVFLPFDNDSILSIILSKALLLADDDQITDPVILQQIAN